MIDFSLKVEAMAWLRFGKQFPFVCTEAGIYNADVLGATADKLIEVEVKKSRADFQIDFKDKTWKHMMYTNPTAERLHWVPNQLYFFVPEALVKAGLEILDANKSPAGLVSLYRPTQSVYGYQARCHVRVERRAKTIHAEPPSKKVLEKLAKRMTSDLVTTRLALENVGRKGPADAARIAELIAAIPSLSATPDWENFDEKKLEQNQAQPRAGESADDSPDRSGSVRDAGTAAPEVSAPPNCS